MKSFRAARPGPTRLPGIYAGSVDEKVEGRRAQRRGNRWAIGVAMVAEREGTGRGGRGRWRERG